MQSLLVSCVITRVRIARERNTCCKNNYYHCLSTTFIVFSITFRTLLNIKSGGVRNPGYEDDELEDPYDNADPASKIAEAGRRNRTDLDEATENAEEKSLIEDLRQLEMNVRGKLTANDWNGALSLRAKKGRNTLSFADQQDTPEADYGDDVDDGSGFRETNFTDNERFKWESSELPTKAGSAQAKKTSASIELMASASRPSNRYVSFHSNHPPSTAVTSLQDYDSLNVPDLAKLPVLTLDTITDCIERRYKDDHIYVSKEVTCC